jgi:hypothetical protein
MPTDDQRGAQICLDADDVVLEFAGRDGNDGKWVQIRLVGLVIAAVAALVRGGYDDVKICSLFQHSMDRAKVELAERKKELARGVKH